MTGSAAPGTLGIMAGYLLRSTIVLTLALVAAAAARRRPAALRHAVLSFALIGLLLLPPLSLAPGGWRSPLVPAWMAASGPRLESRTAEVAGPRDATEVPSQTGPAAEPSGEDRPEGTGRSLELKASALGSKVETTSPPLPANSSRPRPSESGIPADPPIRGDRSHQLTGAAAGALDVLVIIFWAAGLAVLMLRLALGLAGAARLTAEGTALGDPAWRVLFERFLAIVRLGRPVRLRSHPEVIVPLTWGWRKPVVLFPDGADAWTDEERSSALFHELSHIKRSDFLVMVLVRTSLALFWWNPLCWIVYREILKAQEIACDELVLRAGIRPSAYAASLLAFRRSAGFRWNPSAALLGMLRRSSFQERLARILRHKSVLMEVKMKTKIMLAAVLVLAVALIGTARPAAGSSGRETGTVLAETAMPGPMPFDLVPPGPSFESQEAVYAAAQEKEQITAKEAEKEKAAREKKIVIESQKGGGKPIVITITEGDEVKTLTFDKPVTISKRMEGDTLVLTLDGKEIQVLKGEPLRLEIKGGEVQVIKEGEALTVGEPAQLKIVKKVGEEGETVVYLAKPEGKIAEGKAVKIVREAKPATFLTITEGEKEGVWVAKEGSGKPAKDFQVYKVVKEGEPALAWTIKEPGKDDVVRVGTWAGEGNKDMLEKVRALQEQVQAIKAKKMDISALEESLKKLEAELKAKEEKLNKALEIALGRVPGEFTVVKRVGGEAEGKAGVWVYEKDKTTSAAKAKVMIGFDDKDGRTINLMFTGQEGEAGKTAFEHTAAAIEKDLPEGYKLIEKKYDADKGVMTFKISTPPEAAKTDETLVRKLLHSLRDVIKSGK